MDDAGGEGGQDHSQRGEEAAHHHHWTAAEAVHQHTAQRTWTKYNTQSGGVCSATLHSESATTEQTPSADEDNEGQVKDLEKAKK